MIAHLTRERDWICGPDAYFRWQSTEPSHAARSAYIYSVEGRGRERWRRAYRLARKVSKNRLIRIVRAGAVGPIYGVSVYSTKVVS